MEDVTVASLREGVVTVLAADGGVPRTAAVSCVRVGEASALLEFLDHRFEISGWELANKARLKRAVITCDLLTIVASAILPVLADRPTDKPTLDELRRYAFRVKDCALIVGGSFQQKAALIGDRLLNHVNQSRRLAEPTWLAENSKDIRHIIARFKRSELTLLRNDDHGDDLVGPLLPPPEVEQQIAQHVPAPTVRVTSLRGAMEAVVDAAGCPRTVLVEGVHLLHASALEELLSYQALPGRSRCRWVLRNRFSVRLIARMDNLLVTIGAGVLPLIIENPTDHFAIEELRACVDQVAGCATTLGGSFHTEVEEVLDELQELLPDAEDDAHVPEAWLAEKARVLIGIITTLRTRQLTVEVGGV